MYNAALQAVLVALSLGGVAALAILGVSLSTATGYRLVWGLLSGGSILLILRENILAWLDLRTAIGYIPWQTSAGLAGVSILLLAAGWLLMIPVIRSLHRERRLRLIELKKLTRITDASPLLMLTVDSEQRVRFCNRIVEEWFGVGTDDAKGLHIRELVGDEFYFATQLQLHQALTGEAGSYDGIPVENNGELKRYTIRYQPVCDESGKLLSLHIVAEDVTRQREALESLRVAEIKMAELKTIRATSVTYAHKINSPLAGIIANAQMIADPGFDDEERRQIAEEVKEAAQNIQKVTEELMNIEHHTFTPYAVGSAEMIDVRKPSDQ